MFGWTACFPSKPIPVLEFKFTTSQTIREGEFGGNHTVTPAERCLPRIPLHVTLVTENIAALRLNHFTRAPKTCKQGLVRNELELKVSDFLTGTARGVCHPCCLVLRILKGCAKTGTCHQLEATRPVLTAPKVSFMCFWKGDPFQEIIPEITTNIMSKHLSSQLLSTWWSPRATKYLHWARRLRFTLSPQHSPKGSRHGSLHNHTACSVRTEGLSFNPTSQVFFQLIIPHVKKKSPNISEDVNAMTCSKPRREVFDTEPSEHQLYTAPNIQSLAISKLQMSQPN